VGQKIKNRKVCLNFWYKRKEGVERKVKRRERG